VNQRVVREGSDALGAVVIVAVLWFAPDWIFTALVTEDGPLEWLQVLALVVVLGGLGARALLASRRDVRLQFAVATLVAFVAVGEEVAWGSRLFGVGNAAVQAANAQSDLTFHNMAGFRGLHYTFVAIALLGVAGAVVVARRRPGMVAWFIGPALYAAVRVLDNDPISPRFAKLSEILELVLYVALARVVVRGLGRTTRPAVLSPESGALAPVRGDKTIRSET
jgi:hypothetical protein